jgi:1-phosphofructokinase family hexose kinase
MGALVLALNPSIDVEWRVDRVQWEEKNDICYERRWAGGKGVNVSRWLRYLRGNPRLLIPLGGLSGKELLGYLREERLPVKVIAILKRSTRVNVIVTTKEGRQLRFNPAGPELSGAEWNTILRETGRLLPRATCLVLSGSLPQGIGKSAYADLIHFAHQTGVKTILDCDGEALAAAVKARPFLVKPNEHELARWQGTPIRSRAALVRAALALSGKTGGWVLVSLGRRGGMLVNQKLKRKLFARAPRVEALNTVGAGDAMVAAVTRQIELRASPETWLRMGVAVGTAATQCAAGKLPPATMVESILRRVEVV